MEDKKMAKKTYKDRDFKFETLQLHVGQESADPVTDARAVPIYQTSSFVFHNSQHAADRFGLKDAGNIYGRLTNPTVDIFEQRVAALEGGVAALATASGAAAVTYAIQNVALAGDHIVAAKNIYGGTYNLLAHTLVDYGVETTFVDPLKPEEFEAAMSDDFNTALATSSMFGLAKEINIYYQAVTGREGVVCQEAIAEVKRIFKFMTEVIGILEKAWEGNTGANAAEYEELMQVILSVRQACREQKQWALADCIRDRLAEIGITIEDSPQGARWKKREV